MKNSFVLLLTLTCSLALLSCEGRSDKTDGDGITLSLSVPTEIIGASVNFFAGPLTDQQISDAGIGTCSGGGWLCLLGITVNSRLLPGISADGTLATVELQYIEIGYQRVDLGTRLPAPLVRRTTGAVPSGGEFTISNFPIFTDEQTFNEPVSDLLFENGGVDRETGEKRISLNLIFRAYGRTIGGNDVESTPVGFTLDLFQ